MPRSAKGTYANVRRQGKGEWTIDAVLLDSKDKADSYLALVFYFRGKIFNLKGGMAACI